ncbi:MAG TPA: phosphatase PAP2 family protein [Burkholderiaceae bacterium]
MDALLFWTVATNTGAMSVTGVAAAVIAICLVYAGWRKHALAWGLLFCGLLGMVLATKVAFFGWGLGIRSLDFTGLSGHAARASAVFPVMAYLIFRKYGRAQRIAGTLLGVALAMLASWSRVVVEAHSVSEAVSGCAAGLLAAGAALAVLRKVQGSISSAPLLLAAVLLLAPSPTASRYGAAALSHRFVVNLALLLSGRDKPYTREQMLTGR